ncbi:hypothetical protein D9757_007332 [Collybiopsis confluens]|uniref:Ricin B lectin domain-containing protein n=1 Tax=Collybiopsis confluens TaxID=2823264 RepID=A0A8H5CET5_9AGAR|nr:hypothetical protein D9757_014762 [Collybiopsis confluens]KAF5382832.1 hypothetical protein D9757_007332 [Collybiopsis confluens]
MSVESGNVYNLINAKSNTALDLSGTDGRTVSGYTENGGENQKWRFEQGQGGHWTARNVATGQYLGIDGSIKNGAPLIGVNDRVEWDIYPDEVDGGFHKLFVPGAQPATCMDLSDHGNANPGTKVTLWEAWEGKNQCWRFIHA